MLPLFTNWLSLTRRSFTNSATSGAIVTTSARSLYEPAMADHQRLASQCIGAEPCQEERGFSDVLHRSKFAIDRLLEHHVLDHLLLGDAERLRLLGDLLVDQRRAHEAGADDVRTDAMLGALLG